jgi:hypothetical protein
MTGRDSFRQSQVPGWNMASGRVRTDGHMYFRNLLQASARADREASSIGAGFGETEQCMKVAERSTYACAAW